MTPAMRPDLSSPVVSDPTPSKTVPVEPRLSEPLLIELFTEELPPKALDRLGESFAQSLVAGLRAEALAPADGAFRRFATPRRLAVLIESVSAQAPERRIEVKGPSTAVGLDAQGEPTLALRKWAEKQSAAIDALVRRSDGKQECFWYETRVAGASLATVISGLIEQALARLPIPRLMQYQLADGHTTVSFVRPAHGLVVMHGRHVVPAQVLGLRSQASLHGHRFQGQSALTLHHASEYEKLLAQAGCVIACLQTRREQIRRRLSERAEALGATLGDAQELERLLDEVTALVEWPEVYVGRFDPAFLAVPAECLILTMRTHQRYFPLFDAQGRLLPQFLIVSNMRLEDPSNIVDGNERVIRPRLADARFFLEQDRRVPLAERVAGLDAVVYHARLGSQGARNARVRRLVAALSGVLAPAPDLVAAHAERAALLSKADLLTGMVGEFPELQGVMGRHYALHDGEPEPVAQAIAEHYQPRFAGDALPASAAGTVLALADKLETLAGIWGIGQHPTGDKDPFALRRHALGVVRLLLEKSLPVALPDLVAQAFATFSDLEKTEGFKADVPGLTAFIVERLRGYLRDRGYPLAEIDAVLATDASRLERIVPRLEALAHFRRLPEAQSLAAANKRITNMLRKSETIAGPAPVDPTRFTEAAERALGEAVEKAGGRIQAHLARLDYEPALQELAALREPVDAFFDQVMVNAEDPLVRANRFALLGGLHRLMNGVADLSCLAG